MIMEIINKKARFNYVITSTFEAGLVLTGFQVKAMRHKKANLTGSYVKFIGPELFLVGADFEGNTNSIKLLVKKSELISLLTKVKAKNLTLVPIKLYTLKRLIKIEVGLGKSKKLYQKKENIKKRDLERDL